MDIAFFVLPSEGVGSVFMEMSEAVRGASIAVVDHILMAAFPGIWHEIPKHLWAFQAGSWISFSGVCEVDKFYGVFDPENRSGVADEIPVSFFSVEFKSKSWIKLFLPLGSL